MCIRLLVDKEKVMKNFNFNRKNSRVWPLIIICVILAFAIVFGWGKDIGHALGLLLAGATPALIGALLAFMFYRFVNLIEQKLLKNAFKNSKHAFGIKRTISIIVVLIIILGLAAFLIYLFIPKMVELITELYTNRSEYIIKTKDQLSTFVNGIFGADLSQSVVDFVDRVVDAISNVYNNALPKLLEISTTALSVVGIGIISILLTVWFIKDKEKISGFYKRYVYSLCSNEQADKVMHITQKSDEILFNYFISKFIEVAILIVLTGFLYMILGVPYTWELAIIISVFNFIPYVGVFIGLVPVVLITIIFTTIGTAIYTVIFTALIFALVTGVVTPFIIGSKINISGLVVGISILLGGAVFGIPGMLFAPPVVAILGVILEENMKERERQKALLTEQNIAMSGAPNVETVSAQTDTSKPQEENKESQKLELSNNETLETQNQNAEPKKRAKAATKTSKKSTSQAKPKTNTSKTTTKNASTKTAKNKSQKEDVQEVNE